MYFVNLIKKKYGKKELIIFVDMDGVITDYEVGNKVNFKTKRPLMTNIKTIEKLSLLDNVKLHILSICFTKKDIKDKNNWLNKYANFFKEENRVILPKENFPNMSSKDIKLNYLKKFFYNNRDKKIILIDDDNAILKHLGKYLKEIDLYQDSSLLD